MKVSFLHKISLALLLLMAGNLKLWSQTKTYTLVTSNSELVAGNKYLVVGAKSNSDWYALGLQNTNNRAAVRITMSGNSITTTPATATGDAKPFEITLGGSAGAYTLYDAVNNGYLYAPGANSNNYLKLSGTAINWTIIVAADGKAAVQDIQSSGNRTILRFNSTNNPPLFSCYASGQNDVYLYRENNPSPSLNVSPASLGGFSYLFGNGPSAAQSFSVSGSNLTADISLNIFDSYELSLSQAGTYSKSLSLPQTGGTVSATTIWVRLEQDLEAGNYSSVVEISSTAATGKSVGLVGAVTSPVGEPSNHPTNFTASANTTTSLTLSWIDANPAAEAYLIKGSATSFASITAPVDGSPVADAALVKNVAKDIEMHQFTGLEQNTAYYFKIYPYNGSGSSINYKTNGSVPQTSQSTQAENPVVTITGADPGSASFVVGSTNNVLYRIALAVQYQSVTLDQLILATSGNYTQSDIATNGFKLWFSTDASFGGDIQLAALSSAGGHGESLTFSGISRLLGIGTNYLFITADIDASATLGQKLGAQASGNDSFSFVITPAFSGNTYSAGNLHEIIPEPEIAKVFISEYIEGTLNNKVLEIVNKGVSAIDLSKLTIKLYANGATTPTNTLNTLIGTLNPGEVIVIAHLSAEDNFKTYADLTSTVTNYNGDDALEVLYDGIRTDVFGKIGEKPSGGGWAVGGTSAATANKTLIRKLSVNQGNTTYLGSFGTTAENSEWVIKDNNYYKNLGEHGTAFLGSENSDWSNSTNWDMGLPSAEYAAIVTSTSNQPIISGNSAVKNLLLWQGSKLTIQGALSVGGNLINPNGSNGLLIESNASGTGSLLHNSNNVEATVKRYITGNSNLTAYDYHLVSVPLNAAVTTGQFLGSYLYRFDGNSQNWVSMGTSTTTPLPVEQGYMIYYPNESTTYSFEGKLNNGSFTALTSLAAADHFALIPNPYPSSIDWDASEGWTKTYLRDAFWIWNPISKQYATYGAGVGVNGGTRHIPPGQAFFVKSSAASPVLNMNNSIRTHSTQSFFKNGETSPNLLRIKAHGNDLSDEIVLRFGRDAQLGFDEWDVEKLMGASSAPQLYSLIEENRQLAINTLAFGTEAVVVPLGFELEKDTEVSFEFSNIESFDSSVSIFLEDLFTGNIVNIRENPIFSFAHTKNSEPMRFKLHFAGITALNESIRPSAGSIWSDGKSLYFNVPDFVGKKVKLEIFDLSGRLIESRGFVLNAGQRIETKASGSLIVRLNTAKHPIINKVFIR